MFYEIMLYLGSRFKFFFIRHILNHTEYNQ